MRIRIAALALALTLLATTHAQQDLTRVTFQIDGAAVPYYAPVFWALHNGYFAEAGLEVDIIYAGAADILTNIAVGNVEFGFPNADAVISARIAGLPVKVIHTTYQEGIGGLVYNLSSGIQSVADLPGKKIAITSYGSPNYIQLQVMAKVAGFDLEDVDVEIISTGAITDAVREKLVDGMVFSALRYWNLVAAGAEVGLIRSDDFLPSHGNVLVTSEQYLQENPEIAHAFIDALNRGIQFVVDGGAREAVMLSIANYTPGWEDRAEIVIATMEEIFVPSLYTSETTEAFGLGYPNLERWQEAIDLLAEYGVIERRIDATDFVVAPTGF